MFSLPVWSQLNVDVSYSAFDLVQNILIGQGITVTNVQFTGNNAQKAYFMVQQILDSQMVSC